MTVQISPHATALDILDAINNWARKGTSGSAGRLWDILSALRGPDWTHSWETMDLKASTTEVIRRETLPFLAVPQALVALPEREFDTKGLVEGDHFIMHAIKAWDAIQYEQQLRRSEAVNNIETSIEENA